MRRFWVAFPLALTLCACASTRYTVSSQVADIIPAWAGGLPADAPPRQGEPGYDKFVRDLRRPAAPERGEAEKGTSAGASTSTSRSSGSK
jgi:hypothetical protein